MSIVHVHDPYWPMNGFVQWFVSVKYQKQKFVSPCWQIVCYRYTELFPLHLICSAGLSWWLMSCSRSRPLSCPLSLSPYIDTAQCQYVQCHLVLTSSLKNILLLSSLTKTNLTAKTDNININSQLLRETLMSNQDCAVVSASVWESTDL